MLKLGEHMLEKFEQESVIVEIQNRGVVVDVLRAHAMTDEKPKPPPDDWNLHVERDVAWLLNPDASQADRERYAARIRDMVQRVHTDRLQLLEYVRLHNAGWLAPRTREITLGNPWAEGTPEEKKDP